MPLALAIASVVAIMAWVLSGQRNTGPLEPGITILSGGQPMPEFSLEGPRGRYTQDDLSGRWSFVFFGYTQCPDVCPTALAVLRDALARIAARDAGLHAQVRVVFVTVDPKRDTRELVDQYVGAFNPDFIGLRGSDEALAPLQHALGVYFRRQDDSGNSHYAVDHSTGIYLIGPDRRLAAFFGAGMTGESVSRGFLTLSEKAK